MCSKGYVCDNDRKCKKIIQACDQHRKGVEDKIDNYKFKYGKQIGQKLKGRWG